MPPWSVGAHATTRRRAIPSPVLAAIGLAAVVALLSAASVPALLSAASVPAGTAASTPRQEVWVLDHFEVVHTEDVVDEVETDRYISGGGTREFPWGGTKVYTGTYPTGRLVASGTLTLELPGSISPGQPFQIGGGAVGSVGTPGRTGQTRVGLVAYNECYDRTVCPGALKSQFVDDAEGKTIELSAPLGAQTAVIPTDPAQWPASFVVFFRGGIGTTTPGDPYWRAYVYAYYVRPEPTAVPSYRLEVDGNASRLPPSGGTPSEVDITATMLDAGGRPVAGESLQFTLEPADMGSLSTASGTTDGSGEVRVRYRAPTVQELRGRTDVRVVVRNSARSLERGFDLRVERYRVTLVVDPSDIPIEPVWRAVKVTAQVLDFDGRPVADDILEFRVDPPDLGMVTAANMLGNRAPTDSAGRVEGFFEPPPPSQLRNRDQATIYVTNVTHGGEASAGVRFVGMKVIRTWPNADARDIVLETGDTIDIEFDQPVDPATVNAQTVKVETLWHGSLGANAQSFARTIQVHVDQDPVPDVGLQVRVTVAGGENGVKSRDGVVLGGPHELRFKTMPRFDPKVIVSQVVDNPRDPLYGVISLALKPFVLRVDAGISRDSELDYEQVAVRLKIPRRNEDLTVQHTAYPGRFSPTVPDAAAARGNTANFVVNPPFGRGGYAFEAEIRPAHADPEKVITVPPVSANVNSWADAGAARKIGLLALPIINEDIPGYKWTVSRGQQERWIMGLGQPAANLMPLSRLDLRLGYLSDTTCVDPDKCRSGHPWTSFLYWAQHVGRTGFLTRIAGWRYMVALVPPNYFDQYADHPDASANPRMYHEAIQSGIWSQKASAPGERNATAAFPISLMEVGTSPEALVHVLGDLEGLADSSADRDDLSGFDLLGDRVMYSDAEHTMGADRSVMNLTVGFGPTWPATHDYERFLEIWTQRSCLGAPPCPPRLAETGQPNAAALTQPEPEPQPEPVVLVSGTIRRRLDGTETATIDPLLASNGIPTLDQADTGDHAIELRDGTGASLARYLFTPAFGPMDGGSLAGFMVAVPSAPGTMSVVVLSGQTVVAERTKSADPPTVTFVQPQAGSTLRGDVEVAWNGADADGDALTYSLLFSGDGGMSWDPLLLDSRLVRYTLPSALVGNGPDARLRVIAMDGFDSSEAVVGFGLDNPMTVLAEDPPGGARNVAVRTTVQVRLRDPLNAASVGDAALMLRAISGAGAPGGRETIVSGSVGYEAVDRTVVFTPSLELAQATTYEARLSGVRSSDGRALPADRTWTFTTRGQTVFLPWTTRAGSVNGPIPTPRTPGPWPTAGPTLAATATATRGAPATASPTATPTGQPAVSATPTQPPSPSPTVPGGGGSVVAIGATSTGADAAHIRMAFAPGEAITLWLQVQNNGSAPASPFFEFLVTNDDGANVPELSWSGTVEAPAGVEWFKLDRTVPATVQTGEHTFTGSLTFGGQTTSSTTLVYFAQALQVADDFGNTASGWPVGSDASGVYGYADGEYRIALSSPDLWRWARNPASGNLSDFALEADLRAPGSAAGWLALVFGLNASGTDFHMVEIDRAGQYSFYRNVSGTWEPLLSPTFSPVLRTGESTNHLMLVRDSGLTWLYANGQKVTMITDLPAPAGQVGVYASSADAGFEGRFDTFRGYSLP